VIIDGTTAWIMTMNATQSSPTANREYLAVDTDPDDVAAAEKIFEADVGSTAVNTSGKLILAPVNAEPRLATLLFGAVTSIDLEAEELSDNAIVGALTARADASVEVRVVIAPPSTPAQQQAVTTLKQHKVPVVTVSNPYIHAKAAVVDGARAYVGSENFTSASLTSNRELGVVFDVASEVGKVAATISTDFANGSAL
jgi:phosphatidylserine/phosphatidylglycerophosphate/cardiolipin synthase-like enzyme